MLLSLALWIQATDFFTYLRGSAYVYPIILSLHMVAIALFGGMILMTDMRLLGLAMRSYPVSDVIAQFRTPKRIGFVLMVMVFAGGVFLLPEPAASPIPAPMTSAARPITQPRRYQCPPTTGGGTSGGPGR